MPPLKELGYIKSHVSVFKRFSGPESYVRVQTQPRDAPTKDFKALLQLTELVPSYLFSEDDDLEKPLFLRSAGISLGLIFKVKCLDDMGQAHFKELYGLHGALIGAKFEVQYSARSILLHRKGAEAERLRPIKIQIWTGAKELNSTPDQATISRRDSPGPVSRRHREIPLDASESDIEEAKIYLFSQNCIYVTFPLPGLQERLRSWSRNVHFGVGFVMIRGYPIEKLSPEQRIIDFAGVSSYIGNVRARQDESGAAISHVTDLTASHTEDDRESRVYGWSPSYAH
ncbi:hypothetical protein ACEQ8H_005073 [Pleosporales sp. CAS-2024a]